MSSRQIDRIHPLLPTVFFTPRAFQKMRFYVDLCKYEISGLGEIETVPGGFRVQDLFLLNQKCYYTYTELLAESMARFLISMVEQGRDPERLKLWWHSHSGMDVFWSPMDDHTARGFQNDYMLSLVTNRVGETLCRLDVYQPLNLTVDHLPVTLPSSSEAEDPSLKNAIQEEIAEKVLSYSD